MTLLRSVAIKLPSIDLTFATKLMTILEPFTKQRALHFIASDPSFLPKISFVFSDSPTPQAIFSMDTQTLTVPIANETGQERSPRIPFQPITIDDFMNRIKNWELARLDHVGFNLPWFGGIHPEILKLRTILAPTCAYYRFPTGENWDFILPASESELQADKINLDKDRHPKFEIVSSDMTSTPLIQIDCAARCSYDEIKRTLPEGIPEDELKDVWVAIQNPYGIDIFFVIGELKDKDWSPFFEGYKITSKAISYHF